MPWRAKFCGFKLIDQVMKILERVASRFNRRMVHIDEMHFGLMPGRAQ